MRKIYLFALVLSSMFWSVRLAAQCEVSISMTPNVIQLDCRNTKITLTANAKGGAPISYAWSTKSEEQSISVTEEGTYQVTITDSEGCMATTSVQITKNTTAPVIDIFAFPGTICPGDSSSLIAFGAQTYTWKPGPLSGNVVRVGPDKTTAYTVTGTAANGCTKDTNITVNVRPLPDADIAGDNTVCQNSQSKFVTFTGSGGTAPYTFTYTVDGITTLLVNTPSSSNAVSISGPTDKLGKLTFKLLSVTDKNGCTHELTKSFQVSVLSGPALSSVKEFNLCNGSIFSYKATSSTNVAFSWTRAKVNFINNNTENSGDGAEINEKLENTDTQPRVVEYVFTLLSGGDCKTTEVVKVTVNPTPKINDLSDLDLCSGELVSGIPLLSPSPNVTFTWENDNPKINLAGSGTGNIPAFIATNSSGKLDSALITVKAQIDNCTETSRRFKIFVRAGPVLSGSRTASICDNKTFEYTATSQTQNLNYTWKRLPVSEINKNQPGSGTTASIKENLDNSSDLPVDVEYVFTLSPKDGGSGCAVAQTVRVTVNPTPRIREVNDITFCNGEFVSGIPFSSFSPNASFTWTNSNTNINLPATGSGSIAGFQAKNIKNQLDSAIIIVRVKASSDSCAGEETETFKIYVRPGPALTSSKDTSICNKTTFTYTARSSANGTTFSWLRLPVAGIKSNGPDTLNSERVEQTLTNDTDQPIDVFYEFTLKTGGACDRTELVKVTVNPTPVILPIRDTSFCNNQLAKDGIPFRSSTQSAVFTWTATGPGIGMLSDSNSRILPFLAKNNTTLPLTDTVTVSIAVGNGCKGADSTFHITVLPGPALTSTKNVEICDSTVFSYTATSSALETKISWKRLAADRNIIAIGPGSGTTAKIEQRLHNSGTSPVVVLYALELVPTSSAISCTTYDTVRVTVNPRPKVEAVDDLAFCNNTVVNSITFNPLTSQTTFTWISDTSIGFGKGGAGNIPAFMTSNPGRSALVANLKVTPSIGSCTGDTGRFSITVYPTPALTSPKNVSVCDTVRFQYTAESSAEGTTFSWTRHLPGNNVSGTGPATRDTAFIDDVLQNFTRQPHTVSYEYVLQSGVNCIATETVIVTVNPTPEIDSISNQIYCNGQSISGIPFSSTSPGSAFTWTNSNPSIGLPESGKGSIPGFIAVNKKAVPDTAFIRVFIKASADSCVGESRAFRVIVNPSPLRPSFTSLNGTVDSAAQNLCRGSQNINFNVNTPINGVLYNWTSIPGDPGRTKLLIRDTANPNTAISFFEAGSYKIQVGARIAQTGCADTVYQDVIVSNTGAIATEKIFSMQPGNLLVYPDNSLRSYQWGYDSILRTTPDTAFGPQRLFPGQVNQFFVPNTDVDTMKYAYWVLLEDDSGCHTRVYYNGRYANRRVQTLPPASSEVQLQVIPNPNRGLFKMELKGAIYGKVEAKMYNSLGHVVFRKNFVKATPAVTETFNTNNLAAGFYFLELQSSDLKKVVTRFVIQH